MKKVGVNKGDLVGSIQQRGRYFTAPNEIWEVVDLEPHAKLVWMYIYSQSPEWQSSINNVVKNTGISDNTVKKHLDKLESLGMIVVDRSQPKQGFSFYFPCVSNWQDKDGNVEQRLSSKLAGEWQKGASILGHVPQYLGHIKDLLLLQEKMGNKEGIHNSLPEDLIFKEEQKGAKQPTSSLKNEDSDKEYFSSSNSTPEMTEAHPRHTVYADPTRMPPTILKIIEAHISAMGSPGALVDKKGRHQHLAAIADIIKSYGYSKSEATRALSVLTPYVVPNAVKSASKKKTWASDLERDWSIIIGTVYAPPIQPHPDTINKPANLESLNCDISDIFKRSK